MVQSDYVKLVSESLIKQLEMGTAPWQKPWEAGKSFMPFNALTGKNYQGMNALWLMAQGHNKGYDDSRWMTFKQANSLDAHVNKGEKGTVIQYWKWNEEIPKLDEEGRPIKDEEGNTVKTLLRLESPRVRSAVVFNANQISNLAPLERTILPEWERHTLAESLIKDSEATIQHLPGDRAFYRPSTDSITIPLREQFKTADNYYATTLHEICHASGHESRLNLDLSHPFGSQGYAKEELRAEIASMMLGEKLNIGHDPSQHVAYVGSWIKALKDDPKEIFRAASESEKITHYIMEPQHRVQKIENVHTIRVNVPQRLEQEEAENENNKIQIRFSPALTQEQQIEQENSREADKKEKTRSPFQLPDFFLDENQHKVYDLKESGQVRVTADGIYLDQMTDEAMIAAMTLAVEHYPDIPMDLSGPPEVHQRSVELAIQHNIPIQFSDPMLQAKMLNHQRDAETQINAVGKGAEKRMSERIYLAVPYEDRNEAKALGAKWDKSEKAWFIQGQMDEPLRKWEKGNNELPLQERIDPLIEFGDALKSAGLLLDGAPVMDGSMRRIPVEGDDKGQASGAYIGYSDGHPAGFIQNHKTGFKQNWKSSQKAEKISDLDRQRLEAELQEKNEARLREREAVATQTAEAVAAHWVAGEVVNEHPYLTAKGVNSYGLRVNTLGFLPLQGNDKELEPQHWGNKGHLMVPVMDIDGRFLAAQSIDASGRKSFPRGSRLQGGHFVIGE